VSKVDEIQNPGVTYRSQNNNPTENIRNQQTTNNGTDY